MKKACYATILFFAVPAMAQDVPLPARVLVRSLEAVAAHPVEISQDEVIVHPIKDEMLRRLSPEDVLGLVVGPRSSRESDSRWRSVLRRSGERSLRRLPEWRLVDGQVFSGSLRLTADPPTWTHSRLGSIKIDLERTASIRLVDGVDLPAVSNHDVIMLRNGDRVEGFVLELSDPLKIEQETEGKVRTVSIPLQRVAAIALVNQMRGATGTRIWTSDGSVVQAESVLIGLDGYVKLIKPREKPTREVEFRREHLRGVVFDASRLIPLASLAATLDTEASKNLRPWAAPPVVEKGFWPLDAAAITISGPARVRWELPKAGCVVAATAELPIDSIHGDYELVLRDGGREVQRFTMNQEAPLVRLRVELESKMLELELTTGQRGPVHDDLVLHEGVVLLPEKGEE